MAYDRRAFRLGNFESASGTACRSRLLGAGRCLSTAVCLSALVACGGTDRLEINGDQRGWLIEAYGDEDAPAAAGNQASDQLLGAGGTDPGGADRGDADPDEAASDEVEPAGDDAPLALEACDGFAVLEASCARGCHIEGNFYRVTAFADDASLIPGLIDVPSANAADGCGPMIDPDAPTDSLIYRKSAGTQGATCGGAMPAGTAGLGADDLDCLERWIANL